jgi:deferrochelatase/peroxidase EfeB
MTGPEEPAARAPAVPDVPAAPDAPAAPVAPDGAADAAGAVPEAAGAAAGVARAGPDVPPAAGAPATAPASPDAPAGERAAPARRSFLRGALGAGAAGAAGLAAGAAGGYAAGASRSAPGGLGLAEDGWAGRLPAVPFHGRHQPGILAKSSRRTIVAAFTVTAASRAELAGLLATLTDRARFLTAGGTPPPERAGVPPADSGVLGPSVVPDGLMITVGVGAALFDDRYGLASRKPAGLTAMRTFPNDNLDPAQCGGDLSVQLSAGSTDTVLHALRDLARHTRGAMQPLWRIDGFSSPPRPAGTPRNLMGFKDGIANPDTGRATDMDALVWLPPPAHPRTAWMAGGSYLVVRGIRMYVEAWDRTTVPQQEGMIGRRRDSGAPLDGRGEFSTPDYARDPAGAVIPLTAHIRLANPRTAQTASERILRRAWNYDRGIDAAGNLDMGLLFLCYQRSIQRQFETVQARLIDEPMAEFISPFGGGYFFALPGVTGRHDYLGRALLS